MRVPVWLQFVLVLCFLALPILSSPHGMVWQWPLIRMFTVYALFVLFFYLHYYFLLDKFFYTGKYWIYGGIILCSFAAIFLIPELFHMSPPANSFFNHGRPRPPFWTEYPRHFILFFSTLLLGHFIKTNERLVTARQEKANAELSFLKAQVNPHFLFNTLNAIYSLSLSKSEKTPDAVVQLSGMMRHVLVDSQSEKIALQKELDYINNYISLQKLRIDDAVKLSVDFSGDTSGKEIAPLLLIPFLENAFKYGVNTEQNSEIDIKIKTDGNIFTMNVVNRKVNTSIRPEERTGVGLENTRNRLNLLYPNRHQLKIEDNFNTFAVTLTINL